MRRILTGKLQRFAAYLEGVISHLITFGIIMFLLATYFIPEVFIWCVMVLILCWLLLV